MTISIGLSSGWILSTLFRWNVLVVAAIGFCCSPITTASEILTQQTPKKSCFAVGMRLIRFRP